MRVGVNEFKKIALMAPKNPLQAIDFCESVSDDFYKCKSYAVTAYYTTNTNKKLELLNKALDSAFKIKRHVDRGLALVWPLRQLAALKQDKQVAQIVKKILEETKPFSDTTEYLDFLLLLLGALCIGSQENLNLLLKVIKRDCSLYHNNKIDIFLSNAVPIIHKINTQESAELLFLIEGENPRKKAEKRITQEANRSLNDYFPDLQFKDQLD